MSKKMPEHKRIFKRYKAGFYRNVEMSEEERDLLLKHYPFLSAEKDVPSVVNQTINQ